MPIVRVRTEKEEELLALENYWKERLAAQEAETVHRQKLTEQEVRPFNLDLEIFTTFL